MISSEIVNTTDGDYNVENSIFDGNRGVHILADKCNLNVNSCFFHKCCNEKGGGLRFTSTTGNVVFNKMCGKCCYLTSNGIYGIFYSIYGNQTVNLISYYDDSVRGSIRDTLNHETGNHYLKNVNVSNMRTKTRGLAWFSMQSGFSQVMSYSNVFNISCSCEIAMVYSGNKAEFSHLCVTGCQSTQGSKIGDNAGYYLFASRISYSLYQCVFYNNQFTNLFYGSPAISCCCISYVSAASGESCMMTSFILYLNSFECQAKRRKIDRMSCKRVYNQGYCLIFQLIIACVE